MNNKKGFTLIELLAVIVVLAIILAIAIPSVLNIIDQAKRKTLEADASLIQRAAKQKLSTVLDYDVSIINKNNLYQELEINGDLFEAVGVENNNGKITATVTKENMVATSSNDPAVINAKVYGLAWDGNAAFTRTNDAATLTTVQVGVGTGAATNNFDTAEIYNEMIEVIDSENAFIKIPKFYIKKTVNGNASTWQISKMKQDDDYYLPSCFVDETSGKVLPYILVGKYNASVNAGKLESKSEKVPLVNTNITTFRNYAKANGNGYQILDIHVLDVIQTLFYIEFAALDSQSIMQGYTSGQFTTHTVSSVSGNTINLTTGGTNYVVGQMIDVGTSVGGRQIARNLRITNVSGNAITYETVVGISEMLGTIVGNNIVYNVAYLNGTTDGVTAKSGSMTSNSNGKYAMKYRGIENLYGNLWHFIDGINIKVNHQAYAARNADDYDVNKFDNGYTKVGYTNATSNEYIIKMGYDSQNPYIQLPITLGTYAVSQYKDFYFENTENTIALLGGYWSDGSYAGLSYWYLNNTSSSIAINIGSRLLKTPL